jgi:hypothetical protein
MLMNHDPKSALQVIEIPHAYRLSHQARDSISPFIVQPFDQAGLPTAFTTRSVLPRREQLGIRLVEVGIDQLFTIRSGQRKPELPQSLETAVANPKANDLMGQARDGNLQIQVTALEAIANHQLIHFQSVTFDRWQQRVDKTQTHLTGLFLSTARTVSRLTPNVRAMARCDKRSPSALTIKLSFSVLKARLLGSGVHAFMQVLQRSRWLPLRVNP